MSTNPSTRSVKIADDERGGWSSDRPRRDGAPPRPPDLTVRCRILAPSDRLRYTPGSLVLIVSPSAEAREAFVDRVLEDRSALFSLAKVRGLLAGRVPDGEIEAKAHELLAAAVQKRLDAGDSVVIIADGLGADEREPHLRAAAKLRRPRHVILLDTGREGIADEDLEALNELRRRLDAGELGEEGVQTALRLGGPTIAEAKRLVFRPPPKDD
ncbi:MAG: hypothetical protein U0R70_14800 [Solirubrobacteraceae bacterium]